MNLYLKKIAAERAVKPVVLDEDMYEITGGCELSCKRVLRRHLPGDLLGYLREFLHAHGIHDHKEPTEVSA